MGATSFRNGLKLAFQKGTKSLPAATLVPSSDGELEISIMYSATPLRGDVSKVRTGEEKT